MHIEKLSNGLMDYNGIDITSDNSFKLEYHKV